MDEESATFTHATEEVSRLNTHIKMLISQWLTASIHVMLELTAAQA